MKKFKKKLTRTKYQARKRKQNRKTRLRPWFFWFLILIFISLIIISILKLFFWQQDNKKISKLENEIDELVEYELIEEEGTLVNPPSKEKENENDYWYYVSFPFYEVDFTNLTKKNSDTIAFIHLNNTNINYPVVQTTNNDYYLTHAFDKSYNSAGWIYMDYRNKLNPLSDNIVIYGHGRLDNTVFGSLKKTLEKDWQKNKENYIINLSTSTNNYLYQIFSIYTIKSESYYITTDFSSTKEKEKWINTMNKRNTASTIKTKANADDKILTLSTCYNNNDIRMVVQAKLIKSNSN